MTDQSKRDQIREEMRRDGCSDEHIDTVLRDLSDKDLENYIPANHIDAQADFGADIPAGDQDIGEDDPRDLGSVPVRDAPAHNAPDPVSPADGSGLDNLVSDVFGDRVPVWIQTEQSKTRQSPRFAQLLQELKDARDALGFTPDELGEIGRHEFYHIPATDSETIAQNYGKFDFWRNENLERMMPARFDYKGPLSILLEGLSKVYTVPMDYVCKKGRGIRNRVRNWKDRRATRLDNEKRTLRDAVVNLYRAGANKADIDTMVDVYKARQKRGSNKSLLKTAGTVSVALLVSYFAGRGCAPGTVEEPVDTTVSSSAPADPAPAAPAPDPATTPVAPAAASVPGRGGPSTWVLAIGEPVPSWEWHYKGKVWHFPKEYISKPRMTDLATRLMRMYKTNPAQLKSVLETADRMDDDKQNNYLGRVGLQSLVDKTK